MFVCVRVCAEQPTPTVPYDRIQTLSCVVCAFLRFVQRVLSIKQSSREPRTVRIVSWRLLRARRCRPPLRYAQSSGTSLTFQIKSPPTVFRTVFAKKTLQQFWCRNPGSRPHNEHHGSTTEKTKSHQKQHRQDDGNRQRATPSVTSSNR